MAWIYLLLASACEIAFAGCLKMTDNFSNLKWSLAFLFFYAMSAVLLTQAVKTLPIGTAYAVWTGIGAAGAVLLGIFYFKEPYNFWRIFFLCTLIMSIIGLKMVSAPQA